MFPPPAMAREELNVIYSLGVSYTFEATLLQGKGLALVASIWFEHDQLSHPISWDPTSVFWTSKKKLDKLSTKHQNIYCVSKHIYPTVHQLL